MLRHFINFVRINHWKLILTMFRNIIRGLCALMAAVAMAGCGGDKEFRINGRIDGMGTSNLRLVYCSANAVQSANANAIDGKFLMTGRTDHPTLVRVYANNGALLGRLAVEPGETVEVTFNLKEPWTMEADGNDDSEYLARFLKDNADLIRNSDSKGLNAAIDTYVRKYPKRGVSGILMTDYFTMSGNEAQGAELLALLQKGPRLMASTAGIEMMTRELAVPTDSIAIGPVSLYCEADSMLTVNPASGGKTTVIMITDDASRNADSIRSATAEWIKNYGGTDGSKVRVLDIGVDRDTATWHRSLREIRSGTGAEVKEPSRYWALSPRHVIGLEEVAIGQVPWFIIADSTGRVIRTGPALSKF